VIIGRSGRCLSLCLIHPRPGPFTGDRGHPVRAGHERWRPVVNGSAQYSKACEGATLPWVQIPPPPPLTRHYAGPWWQRSACRGSFCLSFWPRNGRFTRSGSGFLRRIVPVGVHPAPRRPTACAPRCHKDYVAPRLLSGAGRMDREPTGPSMTCGSAVSRRPSAAVRRRRSGSIPAVSVVPRRRTAPHRYA
jgi:hypothetical protein